MEKLNKAQQTELCERLQRLKTELEKDLKTGAKAARVVKLDPASVGRLSRMDAMQQQAMAQAAQRNLEIRLQQCRAALAAFAKDEYGYCRRCDEPIGYPRLSAKPEALLCIGCQS